MSAGGDTVPKTSAGREHVGGEQVEMRPGGQFGEPEGKVRQTARPCAAWREGLQGRGELWPQPPAPAAPLPLPPSDLPASTVQSSPSALRSWRPPAGALGAQSSRL